MLRALPTEAFDVRGQTTLEGELQGAHLRPSEPLLGAGSRSSRARCW